MTVAVDAVESHVRAYFDGHSIARVDDPVDGPVYERVPHFHALAIGPGPRLAQLWTYVSLGCWDAAHDDQGHGSEFVLITPDSSQSHVVRLAMNAYYHAGPTAQRLGHGHTVPIGESWIGESQLDHFLLSTPYPFDAELEWCRWDGGHAQLLWLMPITEAERDFKSTYGLDALEAKFDEHATHYWDPARPSVV